STPAATSSSSSGCATRTPATNTARSCSAACANWWWSGTVAPPSCPIPAGPADATGERAMQDGGKRYDVTGIGELVIDLVPLPGPSETLQSAARPGGAPGNVAVGTARLGLRSAMLSKVGREAFGALLLKTLRGSGVATEGVRISEEHTT